MELENDVMLRENRGKVLRFGFDFFLAVAATNNDKHQWTKSNICHEIECEKI